MSICPFDKDLPRQYIEEAFQAGLLNGHQAAKEEGFSLGLDEGTAMGGWLGSIAGHIFRYLIKRTNQEPTVDQIQRRATKIVFLIFKVPLLNIEDPEKESLIHRIHGGYRELQIFDPSAFPLVPFPGQDDGKEHLTF